MNFVGFDKFSLLDYKDYISAVLFVHPCNFRCPFCHNGESILNSTKEIPFEEIIDYLTLRKGLIDAVVISGGEPTLMPDLKEKLTKIKSLGYKIKLDTNGTNPDVIIDLLNNKLIDYVAMDIKNCPSKYELTTDTKNINFENIKKSISIIINSGIDYEFRTTLVSEFHSVLDIEELGKLIKGAKQLYLQKFVDREGVIKKGLHPINEDLANEFKSILEKYIDVVELRGY